MTVVRARMLRTSGCGGVVLSMAAGVLMHRYSIGRADALARLRSMAATERHTLAEQAERILAAVEALAPRAKPAPAS